MASPSSTRSRPPGCRPSPGTSGMGSSCGPSSGVSPPSVISNGCGSRTPAEPAPAPSVASSRPFVPWEPDSPPPPKAGSNAAAPGHSAGAAGGECPLTGFSEPAHDVLRQALHLPPVVVEEWGEENQLCASGDDVVNA